MKIDQGGKNGVTPQKERQNWSFRKRQTRAAGVVAWASKLDVTPVALSDQPFANRAYIVVLLPARPVAVVPRIASLPLNYGKGTRLPNCRLF